jgi:predicted metal-dependent hydrolase
MNIEAHQVVVDGLEVDVVRKPIKNLHLGVYPPNGRIRVAAPLAVSDDAVRLAVVDKLGWIKRQRMKFDGQDRQSRREMVRGETHYFLGRRYRLAVSETAGPVEVKLRGGGSMELFVRPGTTADQREQALNRWYRERLNDFVPVLLKKWVPILGVDLAEWRIKRMKTRWGTCNSEAHRIWLNLELVKRPRRCIEYVVVHELVHLLERRHNDRFIDVLSSSLPGWRLQRDELNRGPLAHETWAY